MSRSFYENDYMQNTIFILLYYHICVTAKACNVPTELDADFRPLHPPRCLICTTYEYHINFRPAEDHTLGHRNYQREGPSVRSPSLSITSPSIILVSFNSPLYRFQRSAASTAIGTLLRSRPILNVPLIYLSSIRFFASRKKKMPPKKKEEEKKILLGRPGNNLKSGIVCRTPRPSVCNMTDRD